MQICIFEDINFANFEPLVFSRPVYDLVCGITSLKEKILRSYGDVKYSLHCRPYLVDMVKKENPGILVNKIDDDHCLFINGRLIATKDLSDLLPLTTGEDKVFVNGETVIGAYLSGKNLEYKKNHLKDLFSVNDFNGLPVKILDLKCANYLWDLINLNGEEISKDYDYVINRLKRKNFVEQVNSSVNLINKEKIFIGENVTIKPGVVLDASGGPVVIDDNAFIYPNAVLEGPLYVGESSKIKSGATIYENVTISKVCKVGGEVEQSIIMPYSNKQHSGFIGHAYFGSWVNIGADTNCSDLKNNYSKVRVKLSTKEVNSGSQFLGLMIGDHSKTAINTMFNTGSVIGYSCNIYGSGFPDKYVPSFTWGGTESSIDYDLQKAIDTAKIVLSRRKITFASEEEKLFKEIFELTKSDREKRGK
jgi:UDP-N-acetylglucosamine diphosphorylase / glucose-1-phosphate thymidylyltransferase / UDP-N-acetylgalactosamine diphosphorylase / glucosamine-1-phosphate N-acetyltransferase / galactosamine-1-phosphate N-acetyltransferase